MGLIVLDAGVVIAILDGADAHHDAAVTAMRELRERGDDLILPASAYAECLVGPSRRGLGAIAIVDEFLDALPVPVEPATRKVAARAAALRAEHGSSLRLSDALVVATALELRADAVLTTDRRWPRLPLAVRILDAR